MQGQSGCQSSWVILLGAELPRCIFILSLPCNGLVSFCSLFFLGFSATRVPQPKEDQHQHLRGPQPAAIAGGGKLAASLRPCSSTAAPSSAGHPRRLWAARLGLERRRRVCHACCARAVCWQTGPGWGGRPAAGQPTVTCSYW